MVNTLNQTTISSCLPVAVHHRLVELFIQEDLGDVFLLVITLLLQELNHIMQGQVDAIEHMVANGGVNIKRTS